MLARWRVLCRSTSRVAVWAGRRMRLAGAAGVTVAVRRRKRAGHRKGKRTPLGAASNTIFASSLVDLRRAALTSIETDNADEWSGQYGYGAIEKHAKGSRLRSVRTCASCVATINKMFSAKNRGDEMSDGKNVRGAKGLRRRLVLQGALCRIWR